MSDHTLVMTPGPGGHYQGHGADTGQISLVLGGDLLAEMTDDGMPPEAIAITLTPADRPDDAPPMTSGQPDEAEAAKTGDQPAADVVDPDAHSKDELQAMAEQAGLPTSGTKEEIADRLNEAATAP